MSLRFAINLERFDAGTKLTDTPDFTSVGAVDDLALAAGSGRFWAAPSTAGAGLRRVLHRGPHTFLDQAVEITVDRDIPTQIGGEALGALLLWQVNDCDPAATLADCSDSAAALAAFACQPLDDVTLGENNHLELLVNDSTLRLVEVLAGVSSTLLTVALQPLHRRLALRVAHVAGDVLLWWNPEGRPDFSEPPIARVHTMLSGAGRMGLTANRDGRIVRAVFEYLTETTGQPTTIITAEEPGLDLSPVRVSMVPDLSRPPVLTGMQVAHYDDTRLPERQEIESRHWLRDGRFALRPGHTYRALAWARTVDDETVTVRSRAFTLPGGCEDTRLRDAEGKLILRPDEDTPAGEVRSDLDILVWPAEFVPRYPLNTVPGVTRAETRAGFDNVVRGVQRASKAPRTFGGISFLVDEEGRQRLLRFLQECRGRVRPLVWTHPSTGEHIIVRFGAASVPARGAGGVYYTVPVTLVEDTSLIEQDTLGDCTDTTDSSGSDGGSGPPGGSESHAPPPPACEVDSVELPMWGVPCPHCDTDTRPINLVGKLLLDRTLTISFVAPPLKSPLHPFAGVLRNFRFALGVSHEVTLELMPVTLTSRHHHHTLCTNDQITGSVEVPVTKRIWRRVFTYGGDDGLTHTAEVRFQAEWVLNRDVVEPPRHPDFSVSGAWGVLFHIYVFTTELGAYTDGAAVLADGGLMFWRDDPYVWAGFSKHAHPQLALVAHIPTTWESSCFNECDVVAHTSEQYGHGNNNRFFGYAVAPRDSWVVTLGGDCGGSFLYPLVTVEQVSAVLPLYVGSPGWDDTQCRLTYRSDITCENCTTGGTAVALDDGCCPSNECWAPAAHIAFRHNCCVSIDATFGLTVTQACVITCPGSFPRVTYHSRSFRLTMDSCVQDEVTGQYNQSELRFIYNEVIDGVTVSAHVELFNSGWSWDVNPSLLPIPPSEEAALCHADPPCAAGVVGVDGSNEEDVFTVPFGVERPPPPCAPDRLVAYFAAAGGTLYSSDNCVRADADEACRGFTTWKAICIDTP